MASINQANNRSGSGVLADQDIMNVKVFLRTYNDVIDCAQLIAKRES